jgi:hypothetical protein
MRLASALVLAVAIAGCAPVSPSLASLAGDWHGRIVTARGHSAARLSVGVDGRYEGAAFFDGADWPLHGAIIALSDGRLRYAGNDGNGTVTFQRDALRLRGDDGATGGVFRRTGP